MPVIKLTAFAGEQPRVLPRLMQDNTAQSAINCRLDDGGLTPHRVARVDYTFADMPEGGYETIYRHQGEWLGWETVVHAAPGPVDQNRLYYTGDGAPKMRATDGEVYDLAMPAPEDTLTAVVSGTTTSTDISTRIYVYTFVSSFGEESEPTQASEEVDWKPGQIVTLSGFQEAPAGRAITKQRIYRSQTGRVGTDLYFIAERAATDDDFIDDTPVDVFAEVLPSRNWNPPLADMQGLISLPNGMMAAFSGKTLCFCEPYHPHAWPEVYQLETDYPIVGLGAVGTRLIILTSGTPYIAAGTSPGMMSMDRVEQNLPCINPRSIVDLGTALAFASHEGLVVADSNGGAQVVTQAIFNRDDWLALNPRVMIASQYSGNYIAGFFALDAANRPISGSIIIDLTRPVSDLIRSDTVPAAWFYDISTGALFFRGQESASIYEFDPPTGVRKQQFWRSKEFVLPIDINFGVILVDTRGTLSAYEQEANDEAIAAAIAANEILIEDDLVGGEINGDPINVLVVNGDHLQDVPDLGARNISVNVYCDGRLAASVSKTDAPARLPSGFLGRRWEITASGDVRIEQIVMAKTVDELRQVV